MKSSMKVVSLIVFSLMLSGCKNKNSLTYLMQHPHYVQEEIKKCQPGERLSQDKAHYCELVLYAAANLTSLINEMEDDPQAFGARILREQMEFAKTKAALDEVQANIALLKSQSIAPADLQKAQEQLASIKKSYHEQKRQITVLLAVVGVMSPG